jgi:hypothetical protein
MEDSMNVAFQPTEQYIEYLADSFDPLLSMALLDLVPHRHLYNTSGSGKTRLSLDGLCHNWGFHITCRNGDCADTIGSLDFYTYHDSKDFTVHEYVERGEHQSSFRQCSCREAYIFKHMGIL